MLAIESDYLIQGFELIGRKKAIKLAKKYLGQISEEFDVIVCTGVSGLLMGPSIADAINKPFCVIRKDGDSTHSSTKIEGYIKDKTRYIIVDDFMETGTTIENIRTKINLYYNDCVFCGAWFYRTTKTIDDIEDISLGNYLKLGKDGREYCCKNDIASRLIRIRNIK